MLRKTWIVNLLIITLLIVLGWYMLNMPGKSYHGQLPPLTVEQAVLTTNIKKHIHVLASEIGERNICKEKSLDTAANYIIETLQSYGYQPIQQEFNFQNIKVKNIIAEKKGITKLNEIVVIGAHYDTVQGSPGADDNASGVAAMLELARLLKEIPLERSVHFVAFVNEEPPFFITNDMGSYHYASLARKEKLNIVAMLSLESIGYYSTNKGSQIYPFPFNLIYPDVANFIGFVANLSSRQLVTKVIASFRKNSQFPSEGIAAPSFVTGVSWSDQWSFWKHGYSGVMVTGTALFRNPNYHTAYDKPQTLDYEKTARVVSGMKFVVIDLGN